MFQLQRSWVNGQNENNSEGVVAGRRRMKYNSFRVDEFAGTVSHGSPESIRGNRWADGFESLWDSWTKRSAVRRGIVVAAKIKQGFKLRQERNMPPRWGWGIGWHGWLQRFRS
jgi:hypothetical protein